MNSKILLAIIFLSAFSCQAMGPNSSSSSDSDSDCERTSHFPVRFGNDYDLRSDSDSEDGLSLLSQAVEKGSPLVRRGIEIGAEAYKNFQRQPLSEVGKKAGRAVYEELKDRQLVLEGIEFGAKVYEELQKQPLVQTGVQVGNAVYEEITFTPDAQAYRRKARGGSDTMFALIAGCFTLASMATVYYTADSELYSWLATGSAMYSAFAVMAIRNGALHSPYGAVSEQGKPLRANVPMITVSPPKNSSPGTRARSQSTPNFKKPPRNNHKN